MNKQFRVLVLDEDRQRLDRVCAQLSCSHGLEAEVVPLPESCVEGALSRLDGDVCDAVLCSASVGLTEGKTRRAYINLNISWGLAYWWIPNLWVESPGDSLHPGFEDFLSWIEGEGQRLIQCAGEAGDTAKPWLTALYGVLYLHLKWRCVKPAMVGLHSRSPISCELPPSLLEALSPTSTVFRQGSLRSESDRFFYGLPRP